MDDMDHMNDMNDMDNVGSPTDRLERLVFTAVIKDEQWRSGSRAVREGVQARLAHHLQQRGLVVHGEPQERIEFPLGSHRVQVTLTADAGPAESAPPAKPPSEQSPSEPS